MSKAVYLHYKQGKGAPFELLRWSMAERFGWTLDYIDSLTIKDIEQLFQVDDGRGKARGEKNPKRGRR